MDDEQAVRKIKSSEDWQHGQASSVPATLELHSVGLALLGGVVVGHRGTSIFGTDPRRGCETKQMTSATNAFLRHVVYLMHGRQWKDRMLPVAQV